MAKEGNPVRQKKTMIEIENPMNAENLDRLLQISSWVDRKLPGLKKPVASMNFDLFKGNILPDLKYRDTGQGLRPRPTSRQLSVYDFVSQLMILASREDRELIYLRNIPINRSYRALRRFYLPISHEGIRLRYIQALRRLSSIANNIGVKNLLK